MSFELSPSAKARMVKLEMAYRRSLADKAAAMRSELDDWLAEGDPQKLVSLSRNIHQLRGSAGLYNCHDLQRVASRCGPVVEAAESGESVGGAVDELLSVMVTLASEVGGAD